MEEKWIVVADTATWMSQQKTSDFVAVARARGFKVARVASAKRFQTDEDLFILDSFSQADVLSEKLRFLNGKVFLVYPGSDCGACFIALAAYDAGARFIHPHLVDQLYDKGRLADYLETKSVRGPASWMIRHEKDFQNIPKDLPLVAKPIFSTGGIANHDWDYKQYASVTDLQAQLETRSQLKAFLASNQLDSKRATVLQHCIQAARFLDVHVVCKGAHGKGQPFHIFLTGEFHTDPENLLIVESKSATALPAGIQERIERFVGELVTDGVANCVLNLQFAMTEDDLYLFDCNLRVAGIWSYLYKLMRPDFYEQVLNYFTDQTYSFELKQPYYLKTPYYLRAGATVRSIAVPEAPSHLLVAYGDHLRPGYRVPKKQNSIQPSPQIFAVGQTESECREKIISLINNTRVEYQE